MHAPIAIPTITGIVIPGVLASLLLLFVGVNFDGINVDGDNELYGCSVGYVVIVELDGDTVAFELVGD